MKLSDLAASTIIALIFGLLFYEITEGAHGGLRRLWKGIWRKE